MKVRTSAFARAVAVLAASVAALSTSARAQTRDDGGLWAMWLAQGDFSSCGEEFKQVRWFVDVQDRNRDEGQSFDTFFVRGALGHAVSSRVTAFLGYGVFESEPEARSPIWEHRIFQQLTWNLPVEGFTLQSRTRLEQRFIEGQSDTGSRLREFVKATVPLRSGNSVFASFYDEVFVDLNDTDWGQRSGLRQNRAFAGLGFFLDDAHHHSLEIGYLNQWIDRPDEDRLNHILSINLFSNF